MGEKPKGRYLEPTRGRRSVPQETQGNPKCQMRTTFRSTSDASSRNSSVEQKSCAAENLVSKPSWTRRSPTIMHSDQFPVAAEHLCSIPEDSFSQRRSDSGLRRREIDFGVGRIGSFVSSAKRGPGSLPEVVKVNPKRGRCVNGCANRRTRLAAKAHEILLRRPKSERCQLETWTRPYRTPTEPV